MSELLFSVIIPTRDRRKRLERTLRGFAQQTMERDAWEVIVVDDASVDDTQDFLQEQSLIPIHTVCASGNGPAAARNLGISVAKGERILLMGDDMNPAEDILEAHEHAAAGSDLGIQGRIEWDPAAEITELMRFMAPEGPQFYFKGMKEGDRIPFSRIYGANFSAPRRFFLQEPFDEHFQFACMEDTEMAWRWSKRGWPMLYSDTARCFHHHHYDDLGELLARQRRAGVEARYCIARHPALVWTLLLSPTLQCLRLLLKAPFGLNQNERWGLKTRQAYLAGWRSF